MTDSLSLVTPHDRPDDKSAADMKVEAGAVLHLVLTLRGGN